MGRLTRDPEVRYSSGDNGTAVSKYSLAVDRRFKTDNEPSADFINCVGFGKTAEFTESKGASENNGIERSQPTTDSNGFMNIPDGIDDELPFN